MNFLNQTVIHKFWGEGVVTKHDTSGFYILFSEGEKKFSYPDSFAVFLRFSDPQLQEVVQQLLKEKEEAKAAENRRVTSAVPQTNPAHTKRTKAKIEKSNIVFKCNYCDGGKDKHHIGYLGACSDEMIQYNIQVAHHSWCSDPNCLCSQYLRGEINGDQLDDLCRDGGFVCYESQMLREWTAFAGYVLKGDNKEEPRKIRNIQLNSLAVLTTRTPEMSEEDRFVFGVFLVDDADEGNNVSEGFVKSTSKYRIELSPTEATKIKFWRYHANDNNPEKAAWAQGLYRYANDIEAAQILRDIAAVKRLPAEKRFAEEFLAHFCKMKRIDTNNIPAPNGTLMR